MLTCYNESVSDIRGGEPLRFEKPLQWAVVFKYFRQFKEKKWQKIFSDFCSKALQ